MIPPPVEITCYRVIQEALNNAIKYAEASKVDIELAVRKDHLIIKISDDGLGFDFEPSQIHKGSGLNNMRLRAKALNGSLKIHSTKGIGTKIVAQIPIDTNEEN